MRAKMKQPLVSVAAWSGTGKTTYLQKLIPEFKRRGLRVAALKHVRTILKWTAHERTSGACRSLFCTARRAENAVQAIGAAGDLPDYTKNIQTFYRKRRCSACFLRRKRLYRLDKVLKMEGGYPALCSVNVPKNTEVPADGGHGSQGDSATPTTSIRRNIT